LLKVGALQSANLKSAFFRSFATDAKGVIQIFNSGAERMMRPRTPVHKELSPHVNPHPSRCGSFAALHVVFAAPSATRVSLRCTG